MLVLLCLNALIAVTVGDQFNQTTVRDNAEINEVGDNCEEEECMPIEEEECGACHSIHLRECSIKMEYTYSPVKVKECREFPCGEEGYLRKCYTKYYTKCSNTMVYRDIEEDHPVCGVVKERKCSSNSNVCKQVPVMKCRIEKRTLRKMMPETSCSRVPTKLCRKEKCERKRCYDRIIMSREVNPREHCEFREKRMCQKTENSTCRKVRRIFCRQRSAGSKPCRKTTQGAAGSKQTMESNTDSLNVSRNTVRMMEKSP